MIIRYALLGGKWLVAVSSKAEKQLQFPFLTCNTHTDTHHSKMLTSYSILWGEFYTGRQGSKNADDKTRDASIYLSSRSRNKHLFKICHGNIALTTLVNTFWLKKYQTYITGYTLAATRWKKRILYTFDIFEIRDTSVNYSNSYARISLFSSSKILSTHPCNMSARNNW